ncbi:sialidase family protein [Albibacterium bauzanense]|uniref:exo-alpha-sialidase n=1 Tax=Albibacterium bauzanense TaxID=653929 RepID=A0A4R1LP53_9SPHI|nr:sialidase family protein [Albibacterium bauzanense]TCK80846.1 sialidase-1 [Albibacterium bauzanense]
MRFLILIFVLFGSPFVSLGVKPPQVKISQHQLQIPVLKGKKENPVLRIKITTSDEGQFLGGIKISTNGTSNLSDIKGVRLFYYGQDSLPGNMETTKALLFSIVEDVDNEIVLSGNLKLKSGDNYFWLSYELNEQANLLNEIDASLLSVLIDNKEYKPSANNNIKQRIGVAVRKHNQDGVHTSRIPGLATSNQGTLLAVFDARYESARDLQGNMDIGLHRSTDKGETWEPIQIVIDMGKWGGLPEKFNGVSDASILVDKNSDAIYIAGLWMHGVIGDDGKWVENLTEESNNWNHQWLTKGSQPGFGVKQTSQFLIVKSTDDGKTWSDPINITEMGKKEEWWLWAPAPGQGITLKDGTLVFPTQGRDKTGEAFSNITYSKDGGKTWQSSNPAINESTTECMAVELSDGSIMLNMRANSNKGVTDHTNGRAIAVTKDLGENWQVHSTSHNALIEPVCMASIISHHDEENKSVLLFSNPNSMTARNRMTIQYSLNDGSSWEKGLLLDELSSRGYSCLANIDENTIGILYESSQADMVFQAISMDDIIKK